MNDFEDQLSQLTLKKPSVDYKKRSEKILMESKQLNKSFNWSYILAFSLFVSLALNLLLFTKINFHSEHENKIVQNTNAQNSTTHYSIQQGTMIEHGSYNDIVIIKENK